MAESAFDRCLRDEPLAYREPCQGCDHLRDEGEQHYVRCAFLLPPLPVWMGTPRDGLRTLSRKAVFGPHRPDAAVHSPCSTRQETPRG